eukprot:TRINITY_DN21173_c0_g1_i1.p1 TRINITY_DN21173_c0_g1~~TRINITY_DN21173_c0_g1_i1.p1  ORF type:complete len:453 (+),score=115.32 TRINITY_DN21173_c0_g1_i1:122-1360(+)
MVNECLAQKPESVGVTEYFEQHLDPVLTKLAEDFMEEQPENPVSFVHTWVDQREGLSQVEDVPLPLSPHASRAIASWRNKERDRELESLRESYRLLEEALETTEQGRRALQAAKAGDRQELMAVLEPAGLAEAPTGPPASQGTALSKAVLQSLGVVLRALRDEGITSASAAFKYFGPDHEWGVPKSHILEVVVSMQKISRQEAVRLVDALEDGGSGRVQYHDFRAAVVAFLASSGDLHCALSPEEFNTIMQRIGSRMQENGTTVSKAFQEWDVNRSGWISNANFMGGLRALRLGLSAKEVAQIFNSLSAGLQLPPGLANPLQEGQVSIIAFEALVLYGTQDSRLKDWAAAHFARLREVVAGKAVESAARLHAASPMRNYLPYSGFSSFLTSLLSWGGFGAFWTRRISLRSLS